MNRILVPTDFSANANKALDYAVHLCKQLGGELYIVHAVELADTLVGDRTGTTAHYNDTIKTEAESMLKLLRESISETENIPVYTGIYNNDVTGSINEVVQHKMIRYVVMGTLGGSGLKEKIFGSKTASFISQTQVPIFVIPPEAEWQGIQNILLAVRDFENLTAKAKPALTIADSFNAVVQLATISEKDSPDLMLTLVQEWELMKCRQEIQSSFPDITLQTMALKGGSITAALEEYTRGGTDLLAMLTYKRNFLTSLFKPSITKQMSYQTKIPLLVIPVDTKN